ncbi:response regulator [Chryseolinea lacunae]|uniref:Response regulator n=1 Tax=Chryseolinea lacunae TaxID=2801331 RepID=A0ABS1KLS0_9BACT|nr:response regulator [Chryseolinea lacunae]MBL0740414.1 response regulator [Chryseolinea lacunae]
MKNVLLVDDDKVFNFINTQMLRQAGIASDIHTAMNGKQAIDYLNTCSEETAPFPDLILLDLNMPIMDGFGFLEAFRFLGHEKENVNIIVLSSSENPSDIHKAKDMGASLYLTKPLSTESLRRALEFTS